MKVHYVTTIDEVLALALPPNPDALAPAAAGRAGRDAATRAGLVGGSRGRR